MGNRGQIRKRKVITAILCVILAVLIGACAIFTLSIHTPTAEATNEESSLSAPSNAVIDDNTYATLTNLAGDKTTAYTVAKDAFKAFMNYGGTLTLYKDCSYGLSTDFTKDGIIDINGNDMEFYDYSGLFRNISSNITIKNTQTTGKFSRNFKMAVISGGKLTFDALNVDTKEFSSGDDEKPDGIKVALGGTFTATNTTINMPKMLVAVNNEGTASFTNCVINGDRYGIKCVGETTITDTQIKITNVSNNTAMRTRVGLSITGKTLLVGNCVFTKEYSSEVKPNLQVPYFHHIEVGMKEALDLKDYTGEALEILPTTTMVADEIIVKNYQTSNVILKGVMSNLYKSAQSGNDVILNKKINSYVYAVSGEPNSYKYTTVIDGATVEKTGFATINDAITAIDIERQIIGGYALGEIDFRGASCAQEANQTICLHYGAYKIIGGENLFCEYRIYNKADVTVTGYLRSITFTNSYGNAGGDGSEVGGGTVRISDGAVVNGINSRGGGTIYISGGTIGKDTEDTAVFLAAKAYNVFSTLYLSGNPQFITKQNGTDIVYSDNPIIANNGLDGSEKAYYIGSQLSIKTDRALYYLNESIVTGSNQDGLFRLRYEITPETCRYQLTYTDGNYQPTYKDGYVRTYDYKLVNDKDLFTAYEKNQGIEFYVCEGKLDFVMGLINKDRFNNPNYADCNIEMNINLRTSEYSYSPYSLNLNNGNYTLTGTFNGFNSYYQTLGLIISNNSVVTLDGATIISNDQNKDSILISITSGKLIIKEGTILKKSSTSSSGNIIKVDGVNSSVDMIGGSVVELSYGNSILADNGGTFNISGGTFTNCQIYSNNQSTLNISGGMFNVNFDKYTFSVGVDSVLNLSGGTVKHSNINYSLINATATSAKIYLSGAFVNQSEIAPYISSDKRPTIVANNGKEGEEKVYYSGSPFLIRNYYKETDAGSTVISGISPDYSDRFSLMNNTAYNLYDFVYIPVEGGDGSIIYDKCRKEKKYDYKVIKDDTSYVIFDDGRCMAIGVAIADLMKTIDTDRLLSGEYNGSTATYAPCIITFGDGTTALDIGANGLVLAFGTYTLRGKLYAKYSKFDGLISANTNNGSITVNIEGEIKNSATQDNYPCLNIGKNTVFNIKDGAVITGAYGLYFSDTSVVNMTGGTINYTRSDCSAVMIKFGVFNMGGGRLAPLGISQNNALVMGCDYSTTSHANVYLYGNPTIEGRIYQNNNSYANYNLYLSNGKTGDERIAYTGETVTVTFYSSLVTDGTVVARDVTAETKTKLQISSGIGKSLDLTDGNLVITHVHNYRYALTNGKLVETCLSSGCPHSATAEITESVDSNTGIVTFEVTYSADWVGAKTKSALTVAVGVASVTLTPVVGESSYTITFTSSCVVIVTDANGETYYNDFSKAISASNSQKITLNSDVTYTSDITITSDFTIDLCGKTMTMGGQKFILSSGTLSITDSVGNGRITGTGTLATLQGGNLTLSGGTLISTSEVIYNAGYDGNITINGGVVTASVDTAIYLNGGALHITGGTVTGEDYAIKLANKSAALYLSNTPVLTGKVATVCLSSDGVINPIVSHEYGNVDKPYLGETVSIKVYYGENPLEVLVGEVCEENAQKFSLVTENNYYLFYNGTNLIVRGYYFNYVINFTGDRNMYNVYDVNPSYTTESILIATDISFMQNAVATAIINDAKVGQNKGALTQMTTINVTFGKGAQTCETDDTFLIPSNIAYNFVILGKVKFDGATAAIRHEGSGTVTIKANISNVGNGIGVLNFSEYADGTVIIESGNIVTSNGTAVQNENAGKVIVNGGMIVYNGVSDTCFAISNSFSGNVTLNGGEVESIYGHVICNSGVITLGGDITFTKALYTADFIGGGVKIAPEYTTIGKTYSFYLESVTVGKVMVDGSVDTTKFVLINEGYGLKVSDNTLIIEKLRTYYYNYSVVKINENYVVYDVNVADSTDKVEIYNGTNLTDLSNAIDKDRKKVDSSYADCVITLGNGIDVLDMGTQYITLSSGKYTVYGKATSGGNHTLYLSDSAIVTLNAGITNTRGTANSYLGAVYISDKAELTIVGGSIDGGQLPAIYHEANTVLSIIPTSGNKINIVSQCNYDAGGTKYATITLKEYGSSVPKLVIDGGAEINVTVSNTAVAGKAIFNGTSNANATITVTSANITSLGKVIDSQLGGVTLVKSVVSSTDVNSTEYAVYSHGKLIVDSCAISHANPQKYAIWYDVSLDYSGNGVSMELIGNCSITGLVFTRPPIDGTHYTGEGTVSINYYNPNVSGGIADGCVVVKGTTDTTKWSLNKTDYVLLPENGNLVAKAQVNVTFDMGGITTNETQSIIPGTIPARPTSPTVNGFTFSGWYKDNGFATEYLFDTAVSAPTTFYAKWTLAQVGLSLENLTINYDGENHFAVAQIANKNDLITYSYKWSFVDSVMGEWKTDRVGFINAINNAKLECEVTATYGTQTTTSKATSYVNISKAKLTVTANAQTITFGENILQNAYAVSGFVGNDTIAVVSGNPVLTPDALTVLGGTTIVIAIGTLEADNYSFEFVNGTLKVNKAKYLSIEVPSHEVLTGVYVKNGTVADYLLKANFYWKTPSTATTVAVTAYDAYYNADLDNYENYNLTIGLTLSKKIIDASVNSKVYNGGLQKADISAGEDYTVTTNNGGTAVGNYTVKLTLTDSVNTKWKHETTVDSGTGVELNFEITTSRLTVTIKNRRTAQGKPLFNLTASDGWKVTDGRVFGSDNLNIVLATDAKSEKVGVSPITAVYNNKNYAITFVNGQYEVYSIDMYTEFMASHGTTIALSAGALTIDDLALIANMVKAYTLLNSDSLAELTRAQVDNINVLYKKASSIRGLKNLAETVINDLKDFGADDINKDGIASWKAKIAGAERAISNFISSSTGLTKQDLDNYDFYTKAITVQNTYDTACGKANKAIADLVGVTAENIKDGIISRKDAEDLLTLANTELQGYITAGGKVENSDLTGFANIARVAEALDVYDGYKEFIDGHSETFNKNIDALSLADKTAIEALNTAYNGLTDKVKALLTSAQISTITSVIAKFDEIINAFTTAETALKTLDGITADKLRNGDFDLTEVKNKLADAKAKLDAYTDLSSGLSANDFAKIGNVNLTDKAVTDYEAYLEFESKYGKIYAQSADELTYAKTAEVNDMLKEYAKLTSDQKAILNEAEIKNIGLLNDKAQALINKKVTADSALDALEKAVGDGKSKDIIEELKGVAEEKTADFIAENGKESDLPKFGAIEEAENKISQYEKAEVADKIAEEIGNIDDWNEDKIGDMGIEDLENVIKKVEEIIEKIDSSSQQTKDELADKRNEMNELKKNLTAKLTLEKAKLQAVEELKAKRDSILSSASYSATAKKEIVAYYANAIEKVFVSKELESISSTKIAAIKEMTSVEQLHVGWLVADIVLALLTLAEITYLVLRKVKKTGNKDKTRAYAVAPIGLLMAVNGAGWTTGVVFFAILLVTTLALGGWIAYTLVQDRRKKCVSAKINDKKVGDNQKETTLTKKASEMEDKVVFTPTVISEELVKEIAPIDNGDVENDKEETEEEVIIRDRKKIFVRYNYSFMAKLIQSPSETQKWYGIISDELNSYEGLKSNLSWRHERFYVGRNPMILLLFRGRTLCVALALDPKKYEGTKYRGKDMSEVKRFQKTPMLLKIHSERKLKYVLELISELLSVYGIGKGEVTRTEFLHPYKTTEELIATGLIKVLASEELNNNAEVVKANIADLIRNKISMTEAQSAITDEVAATLIQARPRTNYNARKDSGKRGIINIDLLSANYREGEIVTLESLKAKKLVPNNVARIKVLARGIIDKPLTVEADEFSLVAVKMILLTGGKAISL